MFSLLWSEHCAYKHSQEAAAHAADRGRARARWARARTPASSTSATAWRARSRSSRTTTRARSSRSRARRPGVGGILRDIFALGARPIAVLDSLRFGEPATSERSRYLLDGAVARDRPLRQLDRRADGRRRGLLRGALRAELPGQRDVRSGCADASELDAAAPRPASATASSCSAPRPAATGSAAPRCSRRAELGEGDEAKRPTVQIGDPFEERKLLECSLRAARAGAARLAPGPRRRRAHVERERDGLQGRRRHRPRRRPRAAARGRHGAVRDHGLRVAGADALRRRARRRSTR